MGTYNLRIFVFVSVGFHVPDDLMGKQLGKLSGFQKILLNIAQRVIS